jgi:small subunit ribosomal protein S17e
MGRIKTTFVKTSGQKIYEEGKDDFTTDFAKNKEIVEKYAKIPSKKLRNTIVGYITRLVKREQE